jgi:alpha-beta hydrolase superfamily lysophospholipase
MDDSQRKILDHPLITETLFYPRRITEAEAPDLPDGRVVRIPAGEHTLGAYWYQPHPDAPTVLFFHGNGEIMTDYFYDYHLKVAELGLNFMVVDYRGYGLSTGSPTLSRLLEDARASWTHVTETMRLPPEKILVMGRSLGSLAALEIIAGAKSQPAALIIESGIARFDRWIDRMGPLLTQLGMDVAALKSALQSAFDHERKIKAAACPVLVMHAPHDEIVPVEHGRALASWPDPSRTTLHVFPRGGHNDIHYLNRDEYFKVMKEFASGLS